MDQWYVSRGKVKKGPFTSTQLRALAQKGQLQTSDMLMREGSQKWVAANKVKGQFPANVQEASPPSNPPPSEPTAFPEPTPAPSEAGATESVPVKSRRPFWIGIGAVAVCVAVVLPLCFLLGGSDPEESKERAENNSKPKQSPLNAKGIPKSANADGGGKGKAPQSPTKSNGNPTPTKNDDPPSPLAGDDDLDLPPVGPTKVAKGDPLMAKYKRARAAYLDARTRARHDMRFVFQKAYAEIDNGNLDAAAKAKAKRELGMDQNNVLTGGRQATHPAVKTAVEVYTQTIEEAARTFGAVAEEVLAAYQQQGVTDKEKLRPLRAGSLCAKHADLLGAWVHPREGTGRRETWIVDFDERTGGFQVEGIDRTNNSVYAVFHGENIDFKDGKLTFSAVQLNPDSGRVWAKGVPVSLTVQKGTLLLEMPDRNAQLHRSVHFARYIDRSSDFVHLLHYLKKARIDGLEHKSSDRPVEEFDITDANDVWRKLALLSSFGYLYRDENDQLPHEQLYIPWRSIHFDRERRTPTLIADLMSQYETLSESPHPYLKRATASAFVVFRSRLRLSQANEAYGNTIGSANRVFERKVFLPAMEYSLLRAKIRTDVHGAFPGYTLLGSDLSEQAGEKLAELLKGVGTLSKDVQDRAKISGLLSYADMAEVDNTVTFWQKFLLPLAKRCGGPKADKPLVSITGGWRKRAFPAPDERLGVFALQNDGDQELTHAVVEIIARNEWSETGVQYYYLPFLDVGESVSLIPHLRWDRRRLDYTNKIEVTWSVWADQGTEEARQVMLTSPAPNADTAAARENYLRYDEQHQVEGEALGTVLQRKTPLPNDANAQRILLREATRPGVNYVFRPDGTRDSTLLLRFLRVGPDEGNVEAEVVDLRTKKPFLADKPLWKGQLDAEGVPSIRFGDDGNWEESGWAFTLGLDDRPMIHCPGGGNAKAPFPTQEIPLFRVGKR